VVIFRVYLQTEKVLPSDTQEQESDNPDNPSSNPIAVPGVAKVVGASNSLGSSPCQSPMLREEYEPSESGESEQDVEEDNLDEVDDLDEYEVIEMDEDMEDDDTMTKVRIIGLSLYPFVAAVTLFPGLYFLDFISWTLFPGLGRLKVSLYQCSQCCTQNK
jgi:hypothetical protein